MFTDELNHQQWRLTAGQKSAEGIVNHDLLIARLKRHTPDEELLRLVNRFLKAGVHLDGKTVASTEGVPRSGPLSQVLSNVLLNDLDWELHRRGHHLVCYADDFQVFVGSRKAGERVFASLRRYIGDSLRLKVNAQKSAADRHWNRTFLGFTFSRRDERLWRLSASPALYQALPHRYFRDLGLPELAAR